MNITFYMYNYVYEYHISKMSDIVIFIIKDLIKYNKQNNLSKFQISFEI